MSSLSAIVVNRSRRRFFGHGLGLDIRSIVFCVVVIAILVLFSGVKNSAAGLFALINV